MRRRGVHTAGVLAVALAVGVGVLGATPPRDNRRPAWASQVDAVFKAWDRSGSPGCAVGVFQNGAIAYEHGYGTADLEHDVPITSESVFYVGSLTKQFTAMAAALAIQQGRLGYDDSIRKYLPEMPAYADSIKVSHLIHHTSGLRDYYTLLTIAGRRWDEAYDNHDVLRMAARQKELNFAPGEEYLYSNTGYTLLATIVERATKTPFAEYADTEMFKPLGMSATHFHTDVSRLVKGRVYGYSGKPDQWVLDTPVNERAGAGGLYTSVRDLKRWDDNFYDTRVGTADLIKRLQLPARLNNGNEISYAWGLESRTYRGAAVVEHSGSLAGYRAHLMRFPGERTSVAVLCNAAAMTPTSLARQIADLVLGSRLETVNEPPRGVVGRVPSAVPEPPAAETLRRFEGTYASDELESTFTITADDRGLLLQRDTDARPVPVSYLAPDQFGSTGFKWRFERGTSNDVTALVVEAGRVRNIRFARRPPPAAR